MEVMYYVEVVIVLLGLSAPTIVALQKFNHVLVLPSVRAIAQSHAPKLLDFLAPALIKFLLFVQVNIFEKDKT